MCTYALTFEICRSNADTDLNNTRAGGLVLCPASMAHKCYISRGHRTQCKTSACWPYRGIDSVLKKLQMLEA